MTMFFTDSVDLVLGPLQVGYSIATFLFGLATVQTYLYFQDFSHDPILYKALVGAAWLFELANQICCSHAVYFYTIISFGRMDVLEETSPESFDLIFLFTGLNVFLVFGFFAYRQWESKHSALSLLISTLGCAQLALYIASTAFAFSTGSVADLVQEGPTVLLATFFLGAAAQIVLTLILAGHLYTRKLENFYRFATSSDRWIMWMISTGAFTSVAAFTVAICFATMQDNLIWFGGFVTVSRLLTITLLASLNTRSSPHRVDLTKPMSLHNMGSSGRGTTPHRDKLSTVQIAIETVEMTDAASLYEGGTSKPNQGGSEKAVYSSPLQIVSTLP